MDEVGPSNGQKESGGGGAEELSSSSAAVPGGFDWRPKQLVFSLYETVNKAQALRVVVRKPLVARLTKGIVETYQICNPQFKYSEELNPKRYLTSPSIGVLNDGYDNVNSDLILTVNCVLINSGTQRRYIVNDVLGHGTFGQVAKCWDAETNCFIALKIIKNQPAYYQQALVEVSILTTLNKKYDPEDKHHIVRIFDYFVYQRHLCICFELLDTNLYELIKINHFRGLSLSIVQMFSKQILCGLALLKDARIIHCDLKPENILLCTSVKPAEIKIIDFGSACMEDRTVYSYIQSRYYRSPEVLLGYQYTTAIDMWSFGCIVAELFLGLPLFPGASEFDLLSRMIEILGGQPPDYVLKEAKNTSKFFKCIGSVHNIETGEVSTNGRSAYRVLTEEEYEVREKKKPVIGKEYFKHMNLEAIVRSYPYRKNLPEEDILKERQIRLALIDFLRGLVDFDPAKRWSPLQASKHPFVTGEPFTCPYKPPPETPRVPVAQNIKVDHHPGGGHWFAAGLSPNIPGKNRVALHNSPHFQMVPYQHAHSYGSVGSYGSYNDGTGLGSSYGSYGDSSNVFAYYSPVGPSGMNMHPHSNVSMLGSSPDTRRRVIQYPHGNGLGISPSAGNFAPLPLGTSPSQFTPPSSYSQVSAVFPGQYGPTSPARGSHGSSLGKMAAVSHFNRRKSSGYSGNSQSQESLSSSHWQGQFSEGSSSSHAELGGFPSHLQSNSNAASWKQHQGGTGISAGCHAFQSMPGTSIPGSHILSAQNAGAANDKPEANLSLPDPQDWDPNYSDDLLLQEDSLDVSEMTTDFRKNMRLVSADGRFNHISNTVSISSIQRQNGPVQAFSQMEVGSPPSGHDPHPGGYVRPMSKPSHIASHISQNSPSRLGQQTVQRFNNGRPPNSRTDEWNHMNVHPPFSSFTSGGPRSPGNSSLSNGMSWGRRSNHPVTNMPPTSRGRKDYGRIS
ncbi:dual specificity protein kinase YAK1 homolog [Juglans microcarpa x Juglans regia]|uniref:dual specificity protein kinase YAK1 homolog n=1 Tax=Juglans microcarpa x Juglans regia TaxID=2249226 RepID=UPI001B7F2F03|nr:dual specificity protein kinase YAK1 homolog [Juglans microcarpa x Juglans regia]XP_041009723.1 dual specificity protein kinase YAK1 homolog [Juglans microcarpa x Juglans regia]